jgi:hypothetical protein
MAIGLAELMDSCNMRVRELCCSSGFIGKASLVIVCHNGARGEKFEGHGAIERDVLGFIHYTHAAFAQLLENLIV